MKIKILVTADHRVSGGVTLCFGAGSEVSVPRTIAEGLIKRGVAEAIVAGGKVKPATKET